jgi:uncharacterized repeat protein (TIGR01451 family)
MDGSRNSFWLCFLLSFVTFCSSETVRSAPATARQKPVLKRPVPKRPPAGARTLAPTSTETLEWTKMSAGATPVEGPGTAYTNTPPPSASFQALSSDGTALNPDTHGAVGPNHLMVTLNSEVLIQDRSGGQISRVSLDAWWAVAGPTAGAANVFDPRVVYDPYGGRFIFSANNDPEGSNSGLLIAVSATSDPTGAWYRRFIDINASRPVFADSPAVGFNRHWIVLAADTYTNTAPYEFSRSDIFVYNKTNFYANGSLAPANFPSFDAYSLVPVVTYDANLATNYLVSAIAGDIIDWPNAGDRSGVVGLFAISGPVTAPAFTNITYPYTDQLWADIVATNLAPQLGTVNRVYLGDSRITSATWRRGTIQTAHTIFLPFDNPTHAAVQWWEFAEETTLHIGRVDGGESGRMYAYPSIAANRNNDVVLGFSRFTPNEYPSAVYAYREDLNDPPDSVRPQMIFKTGNAPYFRPNSSGQNLWGDWSATMIDPLNDTDFWTIQQYADFPQSGIDRWGTWWARVSPPNDLVLTANDAPDPVVAGSNLTYTITVTNLLTAGDGGRSASGVRISNSLPAGLTYVSASASQGTCSHSAGVVICDLGTLTNLARATASITVKATVFGTIDNTIAVHANGPDADFTDNTVTVTTTALPSADLEVLLGESQDPITAGGNLIYTLTVSNSGPAEATLVRVTNTLPASCTFVSFMSLSGGACTNNGAIVSCNLPNIQSNGTATVLITARPNTGGITISNRADVAASSIDPNGANNVRSILTYINARPTISAFNNLAINEDTPTSPLAFTIGDVETAAGSLEVTTSSSMASVIPDANVVLGGSGASRTVTITPAPNQSGSSVITITVTDGEGAATNRVFTVTVNPVNDVPTITPIATPAPIAEDSSTADLPFTIGDVETASGSLTLTRNSSNLLLVPIANITFGGSGADRTVRVTPATNQVGSATITVGVNDGAGGISNVTFLVTVTAVNDPPVITSIADRAVNEDTSTGAIAFNIIDVENGGALTLSAASSDPTIVAINNVVFGGSGTNRTVTILGATNQHGVVQITLTVSDGSLIDTSSFILTINPVNDVPTLTALSNITTNEDAGEIIVPLTGISSGAANEPQELTMTVSNSNPAVIGSYNLNYTSAQPTGTLVLNTATNAAGASTITVTLRDDGASNNVVTRTFIVSVTAINDHPVISDIPDQNIDEDTMTGAIPFTMSDAETPANSLNLLAASSHPTIVPVANITFGGTGINRTVTVRPATNQFGSVTISIIVGDGVLASTNNFLVTINSINDAPAFVTPVGDRSFPEDTSASIPFVIGDVETPAGNLTVEVTDSSNPALAPLSAISFTGSGGNRTVFISPVSNEVGQSTITLLLSDGMLNTFDSFVLTVTNINDAPRITTSIANQTITEDTSTAVIPFTIDDEETPGALTVTGGSSNPALVPVANIVFGGAPSLSRTVQVTPATNQFGSATITVFVSDGGATGSNSFLVTVTPVNDAPIISSIPNVVTNEDFQTVALPFTIRDAETTAANLTLAVMSSNPEVVDDSGIVIGGAGTNRTVTVHPLTNQFGSATIFISVTDASNAMAIAEFEVEFVEVNDRPSISNIGNLTVNEDTNAVMITFTIDDPETLPENLMVTASSSAQALVPNGNLTVGGTFATRTLTMVPLAEQFGTTTISIVVSDGVATNTDTFVLTVNPVNDRPTVTDIADQTIAEDTSTATLAFTIDDVETAETSLALSVASSDLAVVPLAGITLGGAGANRTVTVRPATNHFGSSMITIMVSDGALIGSNSFIVTVAGVNDAPTINAISNVAITEDAPQQTVNFSGVGAGGINEVQDLVVTATSSNPSLIPDPLVSYTSPQTTGTLRFTPTANGNGTATITVTVDDGQAINRLTSRTFTVTVNAANDTPTISNIDNITTGEDTPVSVAFTIGDVETTGSALTLTGASSNGALLANTNITFHGSGSLRTMVLTPTLNQFGNSTVTVTVSDGVATANDTFILTVIGTNDAPTIDPIPDIYVNQGAQATNITLTGITTGAGNETQTITISNSISTNIFQAAPSIAYTSPSVLATLSFRPANNSSGKSVVTVFVRENTNVNNLTTRTFAIYVKPTTNSAAPTISTLTNRTTLEDTPISVPFVIGDSQTPADSLVVSALSTNVGLFSSSSFVFSGTGSNRTLTITPNVNQSGSGAIMVSVADNDFGGRTSNFVLTVTAVNDLPVISAIPSQNVPQNGSTGPLEFSVGDVETPAGNLTLSATSSNPTLVPVPNIVFGGSGTNRSVTVTPASNQSGSSTIAVVVRDANSGMTTNVFSVGVGNNVPTPLGIVRSGNMVTVSWAISAGSFVLQSRTNLIQAWGDVSGSPIPSGGQNTITETIAGGARFYRLRSQ